MTMRLAFGFAALLAMPVAAQPVLTVTSPAGGRVEFTAAQLASMPRDSAVGTSHGTTARYHGVALRQVLAAANVGPTDSLRGRALRRAIVATAADGYVVVFSGGELDRSLGARPMLVADRENGAPLSAADGPVRLVVPADGRPARWVRQLRSLAIVELAP